MAWTKGQEAGERTECGSHWALEEQEYMGNEDGVDQVKEEDDGVMALGGCRYASAWVI
jgi:hypothetical protein